MKDIKSEEMRMTDETATYEYYLQSCAQNEQAVLSDFFAKLALRIHLSEYETRAMIGDYQKAILYYHSKGYSLDEVLETIRNVYHSGATPYAG